MLKKRKEIKPCFGFLSVGIMGTASYNSKAGDNRPQDRSDIRGAPGQWAKLLSEFFSDQLGQTASLGVGGGRKESDFSILGPAHLEHLLSFGTQSRDIWSHFLF